MLLLLGARARPACVDGEIHPARAPAGLRKNDQLLLMLVMSFLLINVFNIRGGGYMYFITYVLQGSTAYTSLFFTMVTFAAILGAVIVNPLSRRIDTVKLYYYTNLVLAALAMGMWFLPVARRTRRSGLS